MTPGIVRVMVVVFAALLLVHFCTGCANCGPTVDMEADEGEGAIFIHLRCEF